LTIKPTNATSDPEVQPEMLDVLLIPGPDPKTVFEERVLEFVRGHVEGTEGKGGAADVCTGVLMLAQAGVLEGKRASGPRTLVGRSRRDYPGTTWDDGRLWSSGSLALSFLPLECVSVSGREGGSSISHNILREGDEIGALKCEG
jgi:transcriptional regulator GlxA family with amidase domain